MDRRLISTIVAISVIYLGWIYVRRAFFPPPPEAVKVAAADGGTAAGDADAGGVASATAPAGAPSKPAPSPEEIATPEQTVALENGELKVVLSTRGAGLKSAVLKAGKFHRAGSEEQVDLVQAGARPLALFFAGSADGVAWKESVGYTASWEIAERGERRVVFKRRAGDVTLTKEIAVPEHGYALSLTLGARNEGKDHGLGSLWFPTFEDPHTRKSKAFFSPPPDRRQAICRAGGKTKRIAVGDKKEEYRGVGALQFAGVEERYFLSALVPRGASPALACVLETLPEGNLDATVDGVLSVKPGAEAKAEYTVYLGPKDLDLLAAVSPELQSAVDFGFWEIVAKLLLKILRWFHGLVPNWGVSIILLTLMVKVLTFPLAHKSMRSGEEMKRLAPKLEELKKKYGADQQRMGAETMKLYKEHNVNPFGGCLPMLIQMPIWIALYTTLYTAVDLYNEPFIRGWITDLTAHDPFYALPLAMGATMLVTQVLTPMPQQQPGMRFMMYGLPVMFSFFMLGLPSGLVLYIFTSNVLSIGQQIWFRKLVAPRMGQEKT